jgi:hypothetical protein
MLRVRFQARMQHLRNLGLPFEPARNRQGMTVMLRHAKGQSLDS